MGLETGDYISDLVDTNPLGTDPKNQGDDHLRLIKKCVQQSFPLVDGAVSIATLNFVDRSADETITGSWTFDQQLNSPGLRPLIDNGGLELFGDANDVTGDRSYIILYGKDNAQNGAIHYSCGLASTHIWDVGSNEIARIDQSNLRLTNAPQFIDAATRRDYVDTEITNASAANNQYTDDAIAALEVLDSSNQASGYLDLGGVRIQWGSSSRTASETPVTFPVAFSGNAYNVQVSGQVTAGNSNNDDPVHVETGSLTTTGFSWTSPNATVVTAVYWIAIGPS